MKPLAYTTSVLSVWLGVVYPIVSQAEGRGFRPQLASLSFSKFIWEITYEINHELSSISIVNKRIQPAKQVHVYMRR